MLIKILVEKMTEKTAWKAVRANEWLKLKCIFKYIGWEDVDVQNSLLSSGILYCTVQRVTIPDVVIIQFVLLKMDMLMLEACRGL